MKVTIAQELKSAGYRNYLIGKWGEGGSTKSKTPNFRGFDYFYGYHACEIDYYTKMDEGKLDLWENNTLVTDPVEVSNTTYSAYLWTCLLYTSPSPRDGLLSRMPSSA